MAANIDFYFDFLSPYSYLAHAVLPRLAAARGAPISYHPFNLVELMKIVGNRPTTLECRNKGAYAMADLQRWALRQQVPFTPNAHWGDIDFAQLGRTALVALDEGRGADCIDAIYPALWREALDLSQPDQLSGVLTKAGLDGPGLLARAGSADYRAKFERSTASAAERGVFGSPTMFVAGEMFFGNDRLDFVLEALG